MLGTLRKPARLHANRTDCDPTPPLDRNMTVRHPMTAYSDRWLYVFDSTMMAELLLIIGQTFAEFGLLGLLALTGLRLATHRTWLDVTFSCGYDSFEGVCESIPHGPLWVCMVFPVPDLELYLV